MKEEKKISKTISINEEIYNEIKDRYVSVSPYINRLIEKDLERQREIEGFTSPKIRKVTRDINGFLELIKEYTQRKNEREEYRDYLLNKEGAKSDKRKKT